MSKVENAFRVTSPMIIDSPAYNAGLDLDDEILSVAGTSLAALQGIVAALAGHRAGEAVEVVLVCRGQQVRSLVTLAAPTELELVPVESAAGSPLARSATV